MDAVLKRLEKAVEAARAKGYAVTYWAPDELDENDERLIEHVMIKAVDDFLDAQKNLLNDEETLP